MQSRVISVKPLLGVILREVILERPSRCSEDQLSSNNEFTMD